MIEKSREKVLKAMLKDYDFGFDVELISSDSWKKSGEEYKAQVYLEFIDTSQSSPHKGIIKVNFLKDTETISSAAHQILNWIEFLIKR